MRNFLILLLMTTTLFAQNIDANKWTYIQVDSTRAKWGDFEEPEWLRYFGLDFDDVNADGKNDIVSGRYVYLNPGGDMTGDWERIDFGKNVDGMIAVNIDDDGKADVIAQALPDVYWLEATDKSATTWTAKVVAQLPKTGHTNGQGYGLADVFDGGKPEILMSAEGGTYAIAIPENPESDEWNTYHLVESKSNEGFDAADMDGDGDLDIVAGNSSGDDGEHANLLSWYENPGEIAENWKAHKIGLTVNAIDRVVVEDLNGDGKMDVGVAEEQWPPKGPSAHLFWFEQKSDNWERHTVVQQWSLHNLDIADIDNDGDMDLATCEHKGEDLKLQIWENDGAGNFTERLIDKGKESHLGTRLCDLDMDGDLDIVSIAWDNYQYVHLWRNDNETFIEIDYNFKAVPHYKIETANATYFLEKSSGGLSSMFDKDRNDWIDFTKTYDGQFPQSASADYRGIPNMVYGQKLDNGTGHPGFNTIKCSKIISKNEIRFESEKGYRFTWKFTDDYAKLTINETIPDQNYWILYEGPVGGKFQPQSCYWGTDQGMRTDVPDFLDGETVSGRWQWVYFGHNDQKRVMFIKQEKPDELTDMMGYMGAFGGGIDSYDGMVVFGFGRNLKTESLLTGGNSFYFGFYDKKIDSKGDYEKLQKFINSNLK